MRVKRVLSQYITDHSNDNNICRYGKNFIRSPTFLSDYVKPALDTKWCLRQALAILHVPLMYLQRNPDMDTNTNLKHMHY